MRTKGRFIRYRPCSQGLWLPAYCIAIVGNGPSTRALEPDRHKVLCHGGAIVSTGNKFIGGTTCYQTVPCRLTLANMYGLYLIDAPSHTDTLSGPASSSPVAFFRPVYVEVHAPPPSMAVLGCALEQLTSQCHLTRYTTQYQSRLPEPAGWTNASSTAATSRFGFPHAPHSSRRSSALA